MDNYRDNMQPDDERYAAGERREAFYNGQSFEQRSYPDQTGSFQNNYSQNGYGPGEYGQNGYAQGDNTQIGYGQGSYNQGYNGQGSYNQGYNGQGSYNQGYNGQYGYGQNNYRNTNNQTGGFAIAALVLGIISILLCGFAPIAMPASIVGIILAVVALSKKQSRGMSIAGMITSIVGGILAIIVVVIVLMMFSAADHYDSFSTDDEPGFAPYPYADEGDDNPFDEFEDFFNDLK